MHGFAPLVLRVRTRATVGAELVLLVPPVATVGAELVLLVPRVRTRATVGAELVLFGETHEDDLGVLDGAGHRLQRRAAHSVDVDPHLVIVGLLNSTQLGNDTERK